MKKIFLTEMEINNVVYAYKDYGLKGASFFSENEIDIIFYEGFAPVKIIPLPKDLPIKELFFKGNLYGENTQGDVERVVNEKDLKNYQNKAAYLVAEKAVTTLKIKEGDFSQILSDEEISSEYNLNTFGKTLYTELAKWSFSSYTEIINFCKVWGLPTGVTVSTLEKKKPINDINIVWMSLDDFFTKVHEYQRIFSYFKAFNTNDFSDLPTVPKKGEHIKVHASRLLDLEMREKSVFSFKIEGQTPFSIFTDLFEAAYFYLKLSIESNAEMRICENCGHLFEITHQRQRFCSVLPGRKRSSCEMAYNNRLKKEKKLKGEI